jgi:hypothetical protein
VRELKIIYREHRGGLKEALATSKEFNSFNEMMAYVQNIYSEIIKERLLDVHLYNGSSNIYGKDTRIGWENTFVINISKNQGVLGFFTLVSNEKKGTQKSENT